MDLHSDVAQCGKVRKGRGPTQVSDSLPLGLLYMPTRRRNCDHLGDQTPSPQIPKEIV